MKKLNWFFLISFGLCLGLIGIGRVSPHTAQAAASDWQKPVLTLGSSLTSAQKDGTIETLTKAADIDDYQTLTVNGATLVKYLNPSGSTFTTSSGVWSSALIQKTSSGSGIKVQLVNYDGQQNITTITADQYQNAALTAGVSDANIYVTSATPIDGSGALAGVYAAYSENNAALNSKQVNAAQNEMSTLSDINQANQDKDGYSDAQLNHAVAEAKKEMATKGDQISTGDITTIVNNQLTENNLQNIMTTDQKNQIINLLVTIRDSGALDSDSFKEQAGKVVSTIKDNAKNIFDKLDTEENRNFLQKLGDQLGTFFQQLWTTIQGWFA